MASTKVALVLDRGYGEKLRDLATRMEVWIIDTPPNKTVAQELWKRDPIYMITTFKTPPVLDETCFEGLMDDIELHHGECSQTPAFGELEVVGLHPSHVIDDVLTDYGFARVDTTTEGFRAVRSLETGSPKLETDN